MVELLLSRGANPAQLDKHNTTPVMLAEKKGEKEVLALLEQHMAGSPTAKGGAKQSQRTSKADGGRDSFRQERRSSVAGAPPEISRRSTTERCSAAAADPLLES